MPQSPYFSNQKERGRHLQTYQTRQWITIHVVQGPFCYLFLYLCVHVYGRVHHRTHMEVPRGQCVGIFLSFHHVGPRT